VNRLLLSAGAAFALALAAVLLVALHTSRGLYYDAELFRRASGSELAPVQHVGERTLATIDVGSLVVGALVLGVVALVQGRVVRAMAAVGLVGVSVGSAELLKHGLPRLPWVLPPGRAATIPSGHAAVAVSLGLALVLAAPPLLRPTAALMGAMYAAAVGFSLVALGWHYPSDVAAAFCLCGLWACVAGLVVGGRPRRLAFSVPALLLALAAVAAGLLVAAYLASRHPSAVAELRSSGSLVATGALVGLLSLATFTVLAPLLEEARP
jgi:membrane-associated phospholipid phosphatase